MSDQSGSAGDDYEDVAGILGEEMQRLDDEADAILNSIRNETALSDGDNDTDKDDYDDMSDDYDPTEMEDEMNDEILKLGTVTATLKQDLDEISVESMTSAMSNRDSLAGKYRQSRSALAWEDAAHFLREKQLYGPGVGGSDRNTPLLVFTITVWSVLLVLVLHVRYGAMDASGNLSSMPQILFG
mmetsp:Transcript_32742/g.54085  ORF Transcript_32742/g.54085 Transcript_32742/m.54085 type:complete len:185 (+) Transcript_32742:208-762(+)|eukprot:CAMPEP_0119017440 /NCGR_PEP_ID=MMETSP1176-20130426/16565_1 /TAXON_ID=265551 /ORGANISM="Synedropsis recta cf, Strain CCMP1620" /LENGTH=184 /DNA_ID=CAMNT_0006971167 /DNA_START=128 /DNA_END=682 /DNA_ORIENTATION=+